MGKYAEQIVAYEAKRGALAGSMEAIMEKAGSDGSTLDASQKEEYDGFAADIKEVDEHLARLRLLETSLAEKAVPALGKDANDGTAARVGVITVKAQPKLAPGIELARMVKCFGMAKGAVGEAITIAKQSYGEDSMVVKHLLGARGTGLTMIDKAEVPAGGNVSGDWAEHLVGTETSAYADFVEWLRPQTIIGKFGNNGIPALRRVPFRVPLVTQTAPGEGHWVGEGKPKPLTSFGFSRTTLTPLKVANIAVLTKEMIRDSSPSAEVIIRDELGAALTARLDIDFVDPNKAASSGVSPASITHGATHFLASGSGDADDIRKDVKSVMDTFVAANNPPSSGVWIMSTTNALALSMMLNPLGQREFPGVSMLGGVFFGLPVIASEYTGQFVSLVNATDIYFADEGGISIDMSTEASLEMLDSSLQGNSIDVNATSLVSLWQTNSVGFLAERALNWARRRDSAVAYLETVRWGGATTAAS